MCVPLHLARPIAARHVPRSLSHFRHPSLSLHRKPKQPAKRARSPHASAGNRKKSSAPKINKKAGQSSQPERLPWP
jgi:hypothetical protein